MSALDWIVLLGAMLSIAAYGMWRTRGRQSLQGYLKGSERTSWVTIGLSVMATQASAITFLSTPGQGYADGLKFVQIYFGLPIAMIIIAAVFLPLYRRLNVFTAYEFLGRRFDGKTRLLGAGLFLLQRGLGAGLTIYAPAIVISAVLGWQLELTIVLSGLVAIIYTSSGGSEAVNVTQKHQMVLIFAGLVVAFFVIVAKLPEGVSFGNALAVAGAAGRLQAVDYSADPNNRYTLWTGVLGGVFLSLAYFGTDQSQVGRYLSGRSLRESRLGLLFNAVFKIPMQFFILLLGTLVFAFYQFTPPPVFFKEAELRRQAEGPGGAGLLEAEREFASLHQQRERHLRDWLAARDSGDAAAESATQAAVVAADAEMRRVRAGVQDALVAGNPKLERNDTDYVFLTFVIDHLPHGIIGLLIAVIFAGGLSSVSAELNALGSTTAVDIYRNLVRREASDAHYVAASKWFTALWGVIALVFAFFYQLADNLIQAVNLIGSIFYGPVLGMFLVAFFLKRVGGTGVFWGTLAAQGLVLVVHATGTVAFLWYNPIGVGACVLFSVIIHAVLGSRDRAVEMPRT
jgi:Na+/proline symporter